MKEKISVIVAAYNTEKYIEKCINSIINQTYSNIELIVVDDASTDQTLQILQKYKKTIKVIKNETNKGQAYARNRALEICSGDYIGFVDSDDYIDLNYYEAMMNKMKEEEADLAICDIKMVYESENKTTIAPGCEGNLTKINLVNNGLAASPCNKLFKKDIIKYTFEEGKINEDIAVVIPAIIEAKKVVYAKNVYYYYIQRKGSTQNSHFSKKRFDIFYGVEQTLERIKECKDYEEIKDALIFNQLISLLLLVFPKIEDNKERKRVLKEYAKHSKGYHYIENQYFKKFLETARPHQKLYFHLMMFFIQHQIVGVPNGMIFIFQWYQKKMKKSVIPEINMEKIMALAKRNQTYSNYGIKITAAIPNYNYASFLMERVYSIVSQKVKIEEILILDDHSKDNSIEVIENIKTKLSPYINIKTIYNQENSGTAFKQWKKAIDNAEGDYIWIAEADDFCQEGLLKENVKPIQKNKNIYLSYCDTAFINQEGKIILKSIIPEIDIQKSGHWNKSFMNDGIEEIKDYAYLNCTIANVSSVLIKKENYEEILKEAGTYKQAGDWFFYISLMKKGDIAFSNKPYNYYRMHGNNVTSLTKKEQHLQEIKRIHQHVDQEFHLTQEQKEKIQKRYEFLERVWDLNNGGKKHE